MHDNMRSVHEDIKCAPCYIACTRVTVYHSCLVDLRWQRSVHTCDSCAFQKTTSNFKALPFVCKAVHFAQCNPVRRPPLGVVVSKGAPTAPVGHDVKVTRHTPAASVPTDGAGIPVCNQVQVRANGAGRRVGKRVVTRRHLLLQQNQQVCIFVHTVLSLYAPSVKPSM